MKSVLFQIFVFILIVSPLAFGTVEPWSLGIIETLSFSAFFLLFLGKLKNKNAYLYEIPGIVPLVILSGYMLLQIVPLPPGVIRIISPETYNIYRDTVLVGAPHAMVPLSIDGKTTFAEFLRIASYISIYALTVQLLADRAILKRTVAVIVIFVSALSLFSILQHFLPNNKIFWLRESILKGGPFGPYVNRNHYAGFMGMVFPVVLSLFLFYKPRIPYKSFREKMTGIFSLRKTNIYLLLGLSVVLIATSVFLTLSRTGIVSLCVSMVVFGMMFFVRGADRKRGIIIIIIFMIIVISVGWFGWDPVIERFSKIGDMRGDISGDRVMFWKDSEHIIMDFPVTGTGFGTFVNIFPAYRTAYSDLTLEHAHNDYIELLIEGGVIAFVLCLWFMGELFYKSYRTFRKRRDIYSIYLFIGSMAGIISMLVSGIADFNMHIGANGLYFFFLSGLAVSAAHTTSQNGRSNTYLKKVRVPVKTLTMPLAAAVLLSLFFNAGVVIGKSYFSSIKNERLNGNKSREDFLSIRHAAHMASLFDPLEAQYHFAVGNVEKLLSNNDKAVNEYMKAVRLNPLKGEYLQRLGLAMSGMERYDIADELLESGIKYDVTDPAMYRRYALWLIERGKKEEGLLNMKKAIGLEPAKTKEYITLMVLAGLSDDDILKSIPDRAGPLLLFGDYLFKTEKKTMAEDMYHRALLYLRNEKTVKQAYFYEMYSYYMKTDRPRDALKIMQEGMEYFPGSADMRLKTAELYEKLGMNHDAAEQYNRALVIEPQNNKAKKKLGALLLKMKGP